MSRWLHLVSRVEKIFTVLHIRFQVQKRQQEPDAELDVQMAKMASELFSVALAYVWATALATSLVNMCAVYGAYNNTQSDRQTHAQSVPPCVRDLAVLGFLVVILRSESI